MSFAGVQDSDTVVRIGTNKIMKVFYDMLPVWILVFCCGEVRNLSKEVTESNIKCYW